MGADVFSRTTQDLGPKIMIKPENCIPGRRGTDGKAASGRFQAGKVVSRAGRSCLVDWDMGEQRM